MLVSRGARAALQASKKNLSRAMSSIAFADYGMPDKVLSFDAAPASTAPLSAGQVKVDIKASMVVSEDIRFVRGKSFANTAIGTAGTTACGVITEVAPGSSGVAVNDMVFVSSCGTWADSVVVPFSDVCKLGTNLSDEQGAVVAPLLAAWGMLNNFTRLANGDVVVHTLGAKTPVGMAIAQVAKAMGLKVVGLTPADLADSTTVKKVGAFKLAISSVDGKPALALVRGLSTDGTLVLVNDHIQPIAETTGVSIPLTSAIFNNISVEGFDLKAWQAADPSGFSSAVAAVASMLKSNTISLQAKTFKPDNFKVAIAESNASACVLKF